MAGHTLACLLVYAWKAYTLTNDVFCLRLYAHKAPLHLFTGFEAVIPKALL